MSLDAEQRAIVARAVTGLKYKVDGEQIFRSLPYGYYEIWEPKLDTEFDRPRSQALALVEWLAKWWVKPRGPGKFDTNFEGMARDIMVAINDGDISRLEQLAFELLGRKDENQ